MLAVPVPLGQGLSHLQAVALSSASASLSLDSQQEDGMILPLSVLYLFIDWVWSNDVCLFLCGRCKRYSLRSYARQMCIIQYIM